MKPYINKFSDKEIDWLKENYNLLSLKDCSELLNKESKTVSAKAKQLGLISKERYDKCLALGMTGKYNGLYEKTNFLCQKCNLEFSEKPKVILNPNKKYVYCKKCTYYKNLKSTPAKHIMQSQFREMKYSAKRTATRILEYTITIEMIDVLYEEQDGKCALTGEPIFFNYIGENGELVKGNASVDRKDSDYGYLSYNIQLVTKKVNIAKNKSTQEDFILMCNNVAKNHPRN